MPLILLAIGIGLIIYNYRAIKIEEKAKNTDEGLDIPFERVLSNNKEELEDYKIEIGILRRDIAESLTELQEEILEMKSEINILKKNEKLYENKEELENNDVIKSDLLIENSEASEESADINENSLLKVGEDVISEIKFSKETDSNKTHKIKKLLEEGLTEEQICHELSVSKGEVLLVKGLFKK
ncbi:hypothetical protein [Clostridium sp. YIM B02555]|uniref:hypothetical protein n=1 Tax=Clostridium sp. YIM B02555 TaxID=2911968 RepID=UPI001EEE9B64|nr:hypothetical protein [Clostridium sp. YIM B02555]